jgi:hypothetical protein
MAYFKINGTDFSMYVNKLLVDTKHIYTARQNASGNQMVKYITKKHNVQVGIIPLDAASLRSLTAELAVDPANNKPFEKEITYLDPDTNSTKTIRCIIPIHTIEYYTIQAGNVMTKAFSFVCEEL